MKNDSSTFLFGQVGFDTRVYRKTHRQLSNMKERGPMLSQHWVFPDPSQGAQMRELLPFLPPAHLIYTHLEKQSLPE